MHIRHIFTTIIKYEWRETRPLPQANFRLLLPWKRPFMTTVGRHRRQRVSMAANLRIIERRVKMSFKRCAELQNAQNEAAAAHPRCQNEAGRRSAVYTSTTMSSLWDQRRCDGSSLNGIDCYSALTMKD